MEGRGREGKRERREIVRERERKDIVREREKESVR